MANSYSQLTSLAAVKTIGIAAASDVVVPDDAIGVMLQAETQNVRFRHDGVNATASVGLRLIAGDAPILLSGRDAIRHLTVIEEAASAKLNIGFLVS